MDEPVEQALLGRLGYTFHDPALLRQALTHKSYVNENPHESPRDNERLELLGDAVLDLVITELIMDRYEELSEGELSKLRASLVSERSLSRIARELLLGTCLRMGRGELITGGREKNSLLADALEALLAAVYMDSKGRCGLAEIERVVAELFGPRIEAAEQAARGDYKTDLQELAQKTLRRPVSYRVLGETGPDHEKRYVVGVFIDGEEIGRGEGRSKKQSEQRAARAALETHFPQQNGA